MLEICLKSGKDRERMRKNEGINEVINDENYSMKCSG